MDNHCCNTCAHYRRHYSFDRRKIFRVHCGHCTYPRVRTKRPDAKACEHYLLSEPVEKAFVTKEYLSKFLLEYMMNLELLPEIHEIEEKSGERKSRSR